MLNNHALLPREWDIPTLQKLIYTENIIGILIHLDSNTFIIPNIYPYLLQLKEPPHWRWPTTLVWQTQPHRILRCNFKFYMPFYSYWSTTLMGNTLITTITSHNQNLFTLMCFFLKHLPLLGPFLNLSLYLNLLLIYQHKPGRTLFCAVTEETWYFKWHIQSWSNSDSLWPLCGHLSLLALWGHHKQEVLCAPSSSLWLSGGISVGM